MTSPLTETVLNQVRNVKTRLDQQYGSQGAVVELEIRFDEYHKPFNRGISRSTFINLNKRLQQSPKFTLIGGRSVVTRDMSYNPDGNRKVVIRSTLSSNGDAIETIRKTKIGRPIDNPDFRYRVAFAIEERLRPQMIPAQIQATLRNKERFSYHFGTDRNGKPMLRFDLTKVVQSQANGNTFTKYEIEIEVVNNLALHGKSLDSTFGIGIYIILTFIQGIRELYNYQEYLQTVKYFNTSLQRPHRPIFNDRIVEGERGRLQMNNPYKDETRMNRKVLYQARNLHLNGDMVFGGLIGNPETYYTATHKTDGVRKVLFVNDIGIWFANPSYELDLVFRFANLQPNQSIQENIRNLKGFFLDGESVPYQNRREVIPRADLNSTSVNTDNEHLNVETYFLVFDCLAMSPYVAERNQAQYANSNIQEAPHFRIPEHAEYELTRMSAADSFTSLFQAIANVSSKMK
jgi:hypothetical protein